MESVNRNGVAAVTPVDQQKPAAFSSFTKGISKVLSQWHALQIAVQNKWGGNDSFKKSEQLASRILCWFLQSKGLDIEDLENLLHESLLFTFNTEIEDGSIEEVAEQLTILHEEIGYYDC